MADSLTPPERETIVNASDADDTITVWSAQRPTITRLRKLASAELIEEGHYGKTIWAKFRLPAESLSFRNPMTAERRAQMRERAIAEGRSLPNQSRPRSRKQTATPSQVG